MKKNKEFISNAIKYYINQKRIKKLRKKGAKIGKNVVICKNCVFDNPQKLVIGDNVWCGCNVVILKGVTIGRSSIIAAGSVVTKSVPPYSIVAGVPARKMQRNEDHRVF